MTTSLNATTCILVRLHTDLTGLTSPGPAFLVATVYARNFSKTGTMLNVVVLSGHQDNWRIPSLLLHAIQIFVKLFYQVTKHKTI
jgi:hypothetical protein